MSRPTKREICDRALSGLPIKHSDVATTNRKRGTMTMRHVWPDDTDGRIWAGVRNAAYTGLDELAEETGKSAELYAADGYVIEQALPGRK